MRRQLARPTVVVAALLGLLPLISACGQPQATPGGNPVPGGAGARASAVVSSQTSSSTQAPLPSEVIAATATAVAAVPPRPGGVPTPLPTLSAPVPTPGANPEPRRKSTPNQDPPPDPTVPADAPVRVGVLGDGGPPFVVDSTRAATIVAIGTVVQVLPARWNTPDGGRPANPHTRQSKERDTIYTPVIMRVETYLKGAQPQPQVQILVNGGVVGQDSITYGGRGNHAFREGERVVVFLNDRVIPTSRGEAPTLNGAPFWNPVAPHFVVGQDGMATDGFSTLPLQQVLDESATASR